MINHNDSFSSEAISGLQGTCVVVGDKSISHRSLILSSIAEGTTRISGMLKSTDVQSTLNAMCALGVRISILEDDVVEVIGVGMHGLQEPQKPLDLGNSGTGVRLLMGIVAGQKINATFTGDESLSSRPMRRITEPLRQMGIQVSYSGDGLLPVKMTGRSSPLPISYNSPVASAQIKSAILLAGLNARGITSVIEPKKSRDHTERMLRHFGVEVDTQSNLNGSYRASVTGGVTLQAKDIIVPRDPSSAAFLIVGALISPNSSILIRDVGLNSSRTALIDVLLSMNASIEILNQRKFGEEEVGDLEVNYSELVSCTVDSEIIPNLIDELPILFIASLFAKGESKFFGIEELKHKESDRLAAMQSGFEKLGIETQYTNDVFSIDGKGSDFLLQEGQIDSFEDHRIAMSFAIAGLRAKKQIKIMNSDCIKTSFPEFLSQLDSLGAILNESK